ncbi:MAG TPA: DNA gyrase inhibitor YacG [Tepidisphaeraceae bacterium]|jgi:hypothetical protein
MAKRTRSVRCPVCRKAVKKQEPDFPFCSERCRQIDLGRWASGAYVISSPVTDISDAIEEGGPPDPVRKS